MKDKKVKNIIKYNIKKNLKNKWFIAFNIICFVACLVALNFSEISEMLDKYTEDTVIEVSKNEDLMYEKLVNKFSETEKVEIKQVDELIYDEENFENNRILIDVKHSDENIINVKIISSELIYDEYYFNIQDATKETRNELYAQKNNITENEMTEILKEPNIETIVVEKDDLEEDKFSLFFIIWTIVFWPIIVIVDSFSKEIFSEKISKSSEYILTNINEKQYVITKIGTTLLNILIQGVAIIIYYLISCLLKSILIEDSILNIINVNIDTIKLFLITFVLYVLHMIVILFIQMIMSSKASEASSADSTQMITSTISMISIMAPFFIVMFELISEGFINYFLSWLPLFSTLLVPAIYIYQGTGILQMILAIIAYIITIVGVFKVAPKAIKNGILNYNPSKKKKDEEDKNDKQYKERLKSHFERRIFINKISRYSITIAFSVILYIVLASFILPLIIDPVLYGIFDNKISTENIAMISSIISGLLALYLPTKLVELNYKKEKKEIINKPKFKYFIMAIPIIVLIFTVQSWIMSKLGINSSSTQGLENTSYLLIFIRLVLIPAIFEELLFRKAIFNASKKHGLIFAVIISAILFGVIHLNFYQAIGATLAGIVFAIVTYKTGSLIPSIILHAMVNGYSFLTGILWADNPVSVQLVNIFVIGFTIIGMVILLENITKNKKKIKDKVKSVNKERIKEIISEANERNVFILVNFYFILAIVLTVAYFALNQTYMGMLM